MKLQSILLLTGIAAGIMTVSCKTTEDEAEEFFGYHKPVKNTAEEEAAEKIKNDYYDQVNAHIDRRLDEFNEKEEVKLPIFSSKEVQQDFMDFSFIKSAEQISSISMKFAGPSNIDYEFFVDRESRSLTRTVGDKTETFTFETFTNGVPPAIPYEVHILYAFATNFSRIAQTVTLRSYEKLEQGENPAIADLENEANIDEKGRKKNKNFVEIKPKTTTEPLEFRIDNRWCKCYDVKLKSICAPAVSMSLFVSNEEKTISRVDFIFDDDSKISYIMDWREQDGIVLPRVIRRLGDNAVFFRDEANVILKGSRPSALELEAAAARAKYESTAEEEDDDGAEEETVEFDASATDNQPEAEEAPEEETEEESAEEDSEDFLE